MPLNIPSFKDPQARKVYLLVGAAAAGAVVYMWWRSRSTTTAAVTTSGVDSGSVTDAEGGGLAAGGNVQYGGANIGSTDQAPTTNSAWSQYAVDLMTQQGWDGITVASALGKYLGDQGLTDAEIDVVRSALALAGLPPEGTHTIRHVVGTEPEQPAPAATHGPRYRVKAGDNWDTIAAAYGVTTQQLLDANPTDPSRGHPLAIGDYIWLPAL